MPSNERDPRKDPRPGDVFLCATFEVELIDRWIMPHHSMEKHGIRGGSEYFRYTMKGYDGFIFYQSVTGMKKRLKGAEVLHVAE